MNKQFLRFTFFLLICLTLPLGATAQVVSIPDPNLRTVIEGRLGKASREPITTSDMAALTQLYAVNSNIIRLTGLEHAINLTYLNLSFNSIADISSLSRLTNLTQLYLHGNSISDISPLMELTNLTELSLDYNAISDISSLSGLTNLTELHLSDNSISDISSLSGLTNLTELHLRYNAISDISSLAGLTNLTQLDLWGNSISDLSALVANTGLGSGDTVNVQANPLSSVSIDTHIPALQSRGVTVKFDNFVANVARLPDPNLRRVIWPRLGKGYGDPITTSDMANLTRLDASEYNIIDLTGLEHAINLTELDLNRNSISDISPLAGLTNLRRLHLDRNLISDISSLAELTNLTSLYLDRNSISDISAVAGLTNLTVLLLWGNSISDISAAAGLTNLRWLHLERNSISDISAVVGLTDLTVLSLWGNSISDISAVAGLTNLTLLHLNGNSISDISAVAGLTNLRRLYLDRNSISDISPLAGLTNLTLLHLDRNSISDISSLTELTNLTELDLNRNSISDISLLAELVNLTELYLESNLISDISSLTGLTNLTELDLNWNLISDLSALVTNTGLGSGATVSLRRNSLSYISINTHIPALQSRGVTVKFQERTPTRLVKISGDNQQEISGMVLTNPFVVEVRDRNGSVFAGVPVTFAVTVGGGTLSVTSTTTDENGRAQSTLTLGPNRGTNTVSVSASGIESPGTFNAISNTESSPITADVNNDGLVNILDLILIASSLGQAGQNDVDVNGDGVISILDLILVAGMFDGAAAAPSAQLQLPATLTAVEVQGWLTDASLLEAKDPIMKRGFLILKQLLASLTPTETELLPNYPNPFNPETWIPYRLAEDAFVTLTIYDRGGQVIRTLEVGHRIASAYENRSKAVYWDGRNEFGERVASGVYFYHLSAGDYSATRKMVILK